MTGNGYDVDGERECKVVDPVELLERIDTTAADLQNSIGRGTLVGTESDEARDRLERIRHDADRVREDIQEEDQVLCTDGGRDTCVQSAGGTERSNSVSARKVGEWLLPLVGGGDCAPGGAPLTPKGVFYSLIESYQSLSYHHLLPVSLTTAERSVDPGTEHEGGQL